MTGVINSLSIYGYIFFYDEGVVSGLRRGIPKYHLVSTVFVWRGSFNSRIITWNLWTEETLVSNPEVALMDGSERRVSHWSPLRFFREILLDPSLIQVRLGMRQIRQVSRMLAGD